MCDFGQRLVPWLLALSVLVSSPLAYGWLETQVLSDVAIVEVSEDGRALVRHEILLRVRGGPLSAYEIDGVDADAEPLPGATIEKQGASGAQATPRPLLLHRGDDGSLLLEPDGDGGLRHGSYTLRFAYRSNLKDRGFLQPNGSLVTLRWVSPRFANGVDSMKVIIRVPSGDVRPRLPGVESEDSTVGMDEASGGVFMASVRRSADKDEVELVRPHVARGEPVVWRVQVSGHAFGVHASAPPSQAERVLGARVESRTARRNAMALFLAALLAGALAALVLLKARALERGLCERQGSVRGIVPVPAGWRALAAGAALGAAVLILWRSVHLLGAVAFVVLAMLLAVHRIRRSGPAPRGPGRWLPLHAHEAFAAPHVSGRYLDATTLPGVLTLGLLAGGLVCIPTACAGTGTEATLTSVFACAVLTPVFFAGKASAGPALVLGAAPRWLGWISQRLGAVETLRVSPWARVPDAAEHPDELRLHVMPKSPLPGLVAMEVALQAPTGLVEPCVLVRVRDGSACHHALSPRVAWVRGRRAGERVAVVHPTLPTKAMALALIRRLAAELSAPSGERGAPPNQAAAGLRC